MRMAQFHEKYNAWGSEYTGVTKKKWLSGGFTWDAGHWPQQTQSS